MKLYDIEFTEECAEWLMASHPGEQEDILAIIGLLRKLGPNLRHPYSSGIEGAKYSKMRELRIQHKGEPYRILYIFDPKRVAILLIGGKKTGNNRWYKQNIAKAEKLYSEHLKQLKGDS